MTVQADGRILLAGDVVTATSTRACIIRLLSNGGLDDSFGDGGIVQHNAFGGTELMSVHAMALDANGQAVLAGLTDLSSNNNVFILRLLSDGGLDPAYGTGGETVITDNAYDDYADALVIAPGGDVYLAGSRIGVGGDDLVFYHIDANGTPLNFGTDVVWQIETNGSEYATRLVMDPQGHLLVSSTTYDENFVSHAAVLRVATTPSLDGSFGNAGALEVTALAANAANALLLQPDGKLLVCGAAYPAEGAGEGLVVRYGDLPAGFAERDVLSDIRLAPNPCHARFTLTAGGASIDRVQVLDAAGRNVLEERIALSARNAHSIELPEGLAPGVYAVLAWSGAQRSTQRLVVE